MYTQIKQVIIFEGNRNDFKIQKHQPHLYQLVLLWFYTPPPELNLACQCRLKRFLCQSPELLLLT
ncbi:unnamed protein product [Schistosoma mattheei]|uniref:Uncharacterized protein n=1 Tax=Schistosoma mattheei TaxID=31246 RepID=A0A183PCC1_9TREM|nr:unnamed protein product [Schistosoma mattheei]